MPSGHAQDVTLAPDPPDGGYGWVIVAASFVVSALLFGIGYSFGIFFDDLIEEFGCNKAEVTLVASIALCMHCLIAPVVSFIQHKHSARFSVILGVIIFFLSLVMSSVTPSVFILYFTYGVVGGIGMGMVYLPLNVIVSVYFLKKRSRAVAIAFVGSFLGAVLIPFIARFFIAIYGWRGAMLLLAAIQLNALPAALFLLPVEQVVRFKEVKLVTFEDLPKLDEEDESERALLNLVTENLQLKGTIQSESSLHASNEEMERASEQLDSVASSRSNVQEDRRRRLISNINPFKKDDLHSHLLSTVFQGRSVSMVERDRDSKGQKVLQNPDVSLRGSPSISPSMPKFAPNHDNSFIDHWMKVHRVPHTRQSSIPSRKVYSRNISKETSEHRQPPTNYFHSSFSNLYGDPFTLSLASQIALNESIRQSSIIEVPENTNDGNELTPNKNPEQEPNPDDKVKSTKEPVTRVITSIRSFLMPYLKHFKDPRFSALFIANMFKGVIFFTPSLFIIGYGNSMGLQNEQSTFLMSLIGFGNVVGRPVVALFGDMFAKHRMVVFALTMAVSGCFTLTVLWISNFYYLAFFVIQFAFMIGGAHVLVAPIAADLVPLHELVFALGVLMTSEGSAYFFGPPLLALLPSYMLTFVVSGLLMISNSLLILSVLSVYSIKEACRSKSISGQSDIVRDNA